VINAPPGADLLPEFDRGWVIGPDERQPFLNYADHGTSNWSDELEAFHEEASRTHFLDVWTREAIVNRVAPAGAGTTIVDLGCSTGYLLADLQLRYPEASLVGVDLVSSGLTKAHRLVPAARLVRADVCELPFADDSVQVVVSANLFEHVPDDSGALAEVRRVLEPGGRAVIVVPAGPGTFDYYDRFLGHERRYARGELAAKAQGVGLEVVEDGYLASLLYPAFWFVKKRNRRRFDGLRGDELEAKVAADIAGTSDSGVGRALRRIEERLPFGLPFGIRGLTVLRRG